MSSGRDTGIDRLQERGETLGENGLSPDPNASDPDVLDVISFHVVVPFGRAGPWATSGGASPGPTVPLARGNLILSYHRSGA